ncbi:MAG TPA: hypothetical protein PK131_03160 [Candidatus Woesebacteria bacterium]|nr:hypothetical protein [Candidatus Woesebacteria bacterium]HRS22908.1 hypothetical protein [Candidatus Woesebacteria bacterium]HRT40263.1 hypothetical protein [Candidatus Woesebacteria bacterium]
MRIYFVASPRTVAKNPLVFTKIYRILAKHNKMVDNSILKWTREGFKGSPGYENAVEKVKKAEIVITEVSCHSLSMGFVISQALEFNRPVIALFRKRRKQSFLKWMKNKKLVLAAYDEKTIAKVINRALKEAEKLVDVRFNFLVNQKILAYLDWVARKKMVPRSVFLRDLIEKEMVKDKTYKTS